jgi:hypothetical protein
MSSRSSQAPRLAYALAQRFGIRVESNYHGRNAWTLEWPDGPTVATMQTALAELAPAISPSITAGEWRYARNVQPLAHAVQMIGQARAGAINRYATRSEIEGHATITADHTDFPERSDDKQELAMARRLAEAADGSSWRMAELVRERGIAWLLPGEDHPAEPSTAAPGPAVSSAGPATPNASRGPKPQSSDPVDQAGALAELTRRYATGPEITAWQRRLATLPVRDAVQRAVNDPAPPHTAIAAALLLLPELRLEVDAYELTLFERARRAGAGEEGEPMSWRRIGQALGVTHQAAQQRVERLRRLLDATATRRRTAPRP